MPKIESMEIAYAFKHRRRKNMKHTRSTGDAVELLGNVIAWWDENGVPWVTMSGRPTVTTRDRLNAICDVLGYGRPFHQVRGDQYFNDRKIATGELIPLCGALEAQIHRVEQGLPIAA